MPIRTNVPAVDIIGTWTYRQFNLDANIAKQTVPFFRIEISNISTRFFIYAVSTQDQLEAQQTSNMSDSSAVAEKGHDDSSKLKTFLSILRKYDIHDCTYNI